MLASAVLWARSRGPIQRASAAPTAPERSGPRARDRAKTPRTKPTMIVSIRREARLRGRWEKCTRGSWLEGTGRAVRPGLTRQPVLTLLGGTGNRFSPREGSEGHAHLAEHLAP